MLLMTLLACAAKLAHGTHTYADQTAAWTAYVPPDDGTPYGAAVLLRALEPVAGIARMRELRGLPADAPPRAIASGPGRLAAALAMSLEEYGVSLLRGPLCLHRRAPGEAPPAVARSRRIGLSKGATLPHRFYVPGHPCVSRPPRH